MVKKFPSLKFEYATLVDSLAENPETGTSIGNQCFKIRLAIASKGRGKRGGARVVTYLYLQKATVYLLTIYDKSERGSVADSELAEIIEELKFD